jgi:hypothetical protein
MITTPCGSLCFLFRLGFGLWCVGEIHRFEHNSGSRSIDCYESEAKASMPRECWYKSWHVTVARQTYVTDTWDPGGALILPGMPCPPGIAFNGLGAIVRLTASHSRYHVQHKAKVLQLRHSHSPSLPRTFCLRHFESNKSGVCLSPRHPLGMVLHRHETPYIRHSIRNSLYKGP